VTTLREPIPRLPVFGWRAWSGPKAAPTPCLLDLPGLHYTTSGRASILLALEALNAGPGDRVLLPSYHCPTMVAPAVDRGAEPVFYPLDENGTPDLAWLSASNLKGVRVMLAAHFFGLPQPMTEVAAWCRARGISLIEDCAHALFGRSGDKPIGSIGDIAIASLTKFLPVPEGGCLVVNGGHSPRALASPGIGTQLRAASDILEIGARQGHLPGLNSPIRGTMWVLRMLRDGGTRMRAAGEPDSIAPGTSTLAPADHHIDRALAHRELARVCRWASRGLPRARIVERRREHYAHLAHAFGGQAGLRPLKPRLPPDSAPYVFPLWVDEPDPLYAKLRAARLPVFRWERLWPGVPAIDGDHGTRWAHHVIQLACHQDLSDDDLTRFVHELLHLHRQTA
jgi:dTDP-4-amino-4,6-dideoxygalactose transaminase